MRQTKYITSGGLAFSEDKDMEKIRRYSLKGWHVNDFKFMGYTLEKGESLDYIYSVDYRLLKKDEEKEYFDFFSSSGWSHVTSKGNTHLFRARTGTKPIYTDHDTTVEKYENSSGFMMKFTIPLVLITALMWIGVMISSSTLKSLFIVVAAILSAIAFPTVWTAITTQSNKWKVEGRERIANLGRSMPFLLLSIVFIILLFVRGTDVTVDILMSAIIGGIALPTTIWAIMSVSTKWRRKKE